MVGSDSRDRGVSPKHRSSRKSCSVYISALCRAEGIGLELSWSEGLEAGVTKEGHVEPKVRVGVREEPTAGVYVSHP